MGFLAALPGIISGAGSLFGGLFGGNASQKAAQQYIDSLKQGQTFLQGQEKQGLENYQPYLDTGSTATRTLGDLLGTPGQGLLANWTQQFKAPTAEEASQTPGYQFQLKAGLDALQNSAAGKGSLLSGRTLADLNNYAQGTASTNYQNTFNNDLTQYQSSYQSFLNNQNNNYQRLMGLSGQGLQAAGGAGTLMQGFGGDIASLYAQQGAARAGGTIGAANAYGSIFPGLANSATMMLGNLNGKPGGGGGGFTLPTSYNPGEYNPITGGYG